MKGRIPEPTALKLVKGVRPFRINKKEPKYKKASGAIPAGWAISMTDIAKRYWKRRAPQLVESGVLTEIDLEGFRVLCELYSEWISVKNLLKKKGISYQAKNGIYRIRPEMYVKDKLEKQMLAYFQHFGMTPASRSKVSAVEVKEKKIDPMEKMWDERHGG